MAENGVGIEFSQRVLLALKEARTRLEAATRAATEPIAIVGIGCRFPGGANGPEDYWRMLREGVDAVGPIPRERYDVDTYFDPSSGTPGKMYAREGAFLRDIDRFDAEFFGISPREANSLDPQQRLLLEVAWEALENAGEAPDQLRGSRSGVFVGIGRNDYSHRLLQGSPASINAWDSTGNGFCYGPGRLAHVLDLTGPNLAIDTACSSSLVAVHLACQSLRLRECDLAIAGGCHVHLSPEVAIMLSMSGALAPDGRCKAFDARADGFGQGEGCGIVVLRRLSDAVQHRNQVVAVILGSAVSHDGHSSGLTVPNQAAQERVIREAVANARIEPHEIGFVEAHGTGTSLGDPIELEALSAVLCRGQRRGDTPLCIGSVKTNIGHLEAAAGIAGLIKAALVLRHGEIPPHLHFEQQNPRVRLDQLSISIPTRPTAWERGELPRTAGVSSFGMSGTNVHVVLREPPPPSLQASECDRSPQPVALSACSPEALRELARRLCVHLGEHEDLSLPDVAFTANLGRAHFSARAGLLPSSSAQLAASLSDLARGLIKPAIVPEHAPPPGVVFLFPGQGSQYGGMARQLYQLEPIVREIIDRCDEVLHPLLRISLRELIFADDDKRLDQTLYTQPALFAVEYAIAALWQSWGVIPRAVLGHSVGEYVAACVAGVFSPEQGLQLIAERARLMAALPGGKMMAVAVDESRAREALEGAADISVAAVNGTNNVVIAGAAGPMTAVTARLEAKRIAVHPLKVSHAFHSAMMDPMLAPFTEAARAVSYLPPRTEFVSNVTGDIHVQAPTAEYWATHARQPVRFADGVGTLIKRGYKVFVEAGPGSVLLGMVGRHPDASYATLLPSLLAGQEKQYSMLQSLLRLYELGMSIDWSGFYRDHSRPRVWLPTYPFACKRYWREDAPTPIGPAREKPAFPSYRLAWRDLGRLPAKSRARSGSWIILADQTSIAAQLARNLEQRGNECILVDEGTTFAGNESGRWTINPADRDHFSRLVTEIPRTRPLEGIIFMRSCGAAAAAEPSADALLQSQLRSCTAVLHLVQALLALGVETPLWLVTRNAVAAGSGSSAVPDLMQASLWGMGRAIAVEHPRLWGGMIDVSLQSAGGEAAAAVAQEIESGDLEDQVLLRENRRLVARIVPLEDRPSPRPLRPDATYLITGGLGDLGLRVARWMVAAGARTLMLLGRREPSPEAHAAIASLRQAGAAIIVARADVAERSELERIFADIMASLPPLRGVVHAAGVYGHQPLTDLEPGAFRTVFRAKVAGAWLLHQLTSRLDLDFFVCFSSLASLWGSKGQAHYAAANAFLDAFAQYRRQSGLPGLSINWGPWRADGMATAEARRWLARVGIRSLEPERALATLARHLASEHSEIAVADVDWARFQELHNAGRPRRLLAEIAPAAEAEGCAPASATGSITAELAHLTTGERREWLLNYLQREVSLVLGLDNPGSLDIRAGFFRLGMDSMMAVELKNRLVQAFQDQLPATVIFDHPSIAGLAEYLSPRVLGSGEPRPAAEAETKTVEASIRASLDVLAAGLRPSIASKLARLESLIREI
jgi:acyl transferase domain-containing protein